MCLIFGCFPSVILKGCIQSLTIRPQLLNRPPQLASVDASTSDDVKDEVSTGRAAKQPSIVGDWQAKGVSCPSGTVATEERNKPNATKSVVI